MTRLNADRSRVPPIRIMRVVDALGARLCYRVLDVVDILSLAVVVLALSLRPLTWRRTVRRELLRQCHLSGVQALPSAALLGVLLGLGMVFQAVYWLEAIGQVELVARLLVRALVQEMAPLLVAVVLLGRSGSAIAAELATMRSAGQLDALDAMGLDTLLHAVVPRVVGLIVAALGLTVCVTAVALLSGFAMTNAVGIGRANLIESLDAVLRRIEPGVYLAVVLKAFLAGLFIGVICCRDGVAMADEGGVPGVLSRSYIEGLIVVFLLAGAVSLML